MPDPRETTRLSPVQERQFRAWAAANHVADVDHPDSHYDYRGFWLDTGGKAIRGGIDHFPDTYKQHGHPTFSVESKYSRGPGDGGRWNGEQFMPNPTRDQSRGERHAEPSDADRAIAAEYLAKRKLASGEPPSPAVQEALHSFKQAPGLADISAAAARMDPVTAAEFKAFAMQLSPRARAEVGGLRTRDVGTEPDPRSPYADYSKPLPARKPAAPYGGDEDARVSPYATSPPVVTVGKSLLPGDAVAGGPAPAPAAPPPRYRQGVTTVEEPKAFKPGTKSDEASLLGRAIDILKDKLDGKAQSAPGAPSPAERALDSDPDEIERRFREKHTDQYNAHEIAL